MYRGNKMRDYIIMTDSCCSLNQAEVEELGLKVIPLSFTIDGKTYIDTPDHAGMNPETFFKKIKAGAKCQTAAVNPEQYIEAMRPVLLEGKDILCICFSSALSATYNSACIAARELGEEFNDAKIIVVDSLCACRGMGMLIYRTVMERRRTKVDIETLAKFVYEQRDRQGHWFFVDDLNHLKRGGRLNAVTAIAGIVLGIRPVMHCDGEGKLTPVSKARGAKGALRAIFDKMEETGDDIKNQKTVFICHAACPEYVQFISELIREKYGITDIRADYICPVVGAHTGCGTLGLFFVANER